MAERPRTGGPEDGPDFNWLYGKRPDGSSPGSAPGSTPGAAPGPGPDDATRMMPTQPRPTTASAQGAGQASGQGTSPVPPPVVPAPTPRPAPDPSQRPPGGGGRGGSSRFKRPRFWVRTVFVVLLLWVVYLVAVPFFAWSKVEKVDFEPDGQRPDEQGGTTYLLVGSDSRADLSGEERRELGTGNAEGQRTDTIMLLHTGSGPNVLMSIPRDSQVDIPGNGQGKVNAAFALGGPKLLVRTLENETGIRIDQYVEIGLGGFVDIVDAVGGIEICPEDAMVDPQANLDIPQGCQEADGATALGYARSRKTYQELGDVQRAQAQREVVSAIGSKVISPWSVLNPFRYWSLNMAATRAVAFGEGTNPVRAAMFASAMTNVNGEDGLTCGVPIQDLAVTWDEERSQQMFDAIIEDDTDSIGRRLCTPSGFPR